MKRLFLSVSLCLFGISNIYAMQQDINPPVEQKEAKKRKRPEVERSRELPEKKVRTKE